MIIDIHAHVWTDPAAQQRRAAEAGVDTDVLLSTRFHPEACTTITELTAEFGRLLDGLDGQGVPADPFEHATAEGSEPQRAHAAGSRVDRRPDPGSSAIRAAASSAWMHG